MCAFLFAEPFGSVLNLKFGARKTAMLATMLVVVGQVASFFVTRLIEFAVTFGLVFGVGMGLLYVYPLQTMLSWTPPEKHGFVSGVMSAGLGLGSFIWGQTAAGFINPSNEDPGKNGKDLSSSVRDRVPYLFILYAAIFAILIVLAMTLFLKPNPNVRAEKAKRTVGFEIFGHKKFWYMWLVFISISM
jgi:fucose permease